MLPSSSTNGILDHTIHAPIDDINLDLANDGKTDTDIKKKNSNCG